MTKKENLTNGVLIANSSTEQQLIILTGITTSQIRTREKLSNTFAYCFLKSEQNQPDIPVIFRIKENDNWIKPIIKKGTYLEVQDHFDNPINQKQRKSFTVTSYHLYQERRIRKKCFGCGDKFFTTQQLDYDYCSPCELNGSRYLPGRFTKNKCSECSDGNGIIKFSQQPPRQCKTCHLAKVAIVEQAKNQLSVLTQQLAEIKQIRQQLTNHD